MSDGFFCSIQGNGIYETLTLPAIPRKGDILALGSLTLGHSDVSRVVVSEVEWAKVQDSGHLHVWITVRRINVKANL